MKTIAAATISFGQLAIPVRIFAAVESKSDIKFNLLHAGCGARLKQQFACTKCVAAAGDGATPAAKVVERDQQLKGYEFERDTFVTFTAEELEELDVESDREIKIGGFYRMPDGIAHERVERCFFVGPDKGGGEKYLLLVMALQKTERVAVARYCVRGELHLVALAAEGDRLLMMQLRASDEVRSLADVEVDNEAQGVATDALELAVKFIERFEPLPGFDPTTWQDESKARAQALIDRKLKAKDIVAAPTPARPEPIADVLDALKASVKGVHKTRRRRETAAAGDR